jgi:tetratricopeptide (TPR) repeat protein
VANSDKFNTNYTAGKLAFEGGNYRMAIDYLEAAMLEINPNSKIGGEAQMWLVTAYEAGGNLTEAIALCRQLKKHPSLDIREKSKKLLYILEAPQLARKPEWLTEIPDLNNLDNPKKLPVATPKKKPGKPINPYLQISEITPEEIEDGDNGFIWLALGIVIATSISLWLITN